MPWFKISDDWIDHPKVQRAGKNGRALWVTTGNRCAKYSSDGLIEGDLVRSYAALADVPATATIKKLVELALWHDHETLKSCSECVRDVAAINLIRDTEKVPLLKVTAGDYYFHDWAFHQLSKRRLMSPEAREAEDRAKALRKDTALCQAIQRRDGSLCRYCGKRVNWLHRKGAQQATYDHVDPFCYEPHGGNFLDAVVTACGKCNGEKGQRTAKEWAAEGGFPLRPPRWESGDPWPPIGRSGSNPGSNSDQIPDPPKSDSGSNPSHVHGRPDARLGSGQVRVGSGMDPGQIGLGRLGSAPGLAGLVRSGSAEGAQPQPTTEVRGADPSERDQADGSPSLEEHVCGVIPSTANHFFLPSECPWCEMTDEKASDR